jgi:hypothetical protein
MGIKLEIRLEALADPAVAQAVSQLLLALGEASPALLRNLARETEQAPLPAAVAEPPPPRPAPVRAAPAAKPARPAPAPAKAPEPPARPSRPAPARAAGGTDLGERWRSFVEQLPERSQRFLDLVRERGVLPIDEAMSALDIQVPKAMGGITGSIGRWAPVRQVPIPYEATEMPDGRRAWRWVGIGDSGADAGGRQKQPPRKARTPVKVSGDLAPAAEEPPPAAPKARASSAPAAAKTRAVRPVTPKARAAAEPAAPKARAAAEPAAPKARAAAEPAAPKARAAAEPAEPAKTAGTGGRSPAYRAFLEALPPNSLRFVQLLESRGRLVMPQVLEEFGLARAKAVGGIIEPVKRVAEKHGLPPLFEAGQTEEGERMWIWHPPA